MRLPGLAPLVVLVAAIACGGSDDDAAGDAGGDADAEPLDPGTANVWVDADGGACVRSAEPVVYVDADACDTFDAAWDAALAGDIVRVVTGTYGAQSITDPKDSETRIIAQDGTTIAGLDVPSADFVTVENLIIDVGDEHGASNAGKFDAADVTLRDVSFHGTYVSTLVTGARFTWQRGSMGEDGTVGGVRSCAEGDGLTMWLDGDDATFDGIRWNPQQASTEDPTCGDDSVFHMESLRVQGARNTTVRNNWFLTGDNGSGHIFITTTSPDDVQPTGFRLENTVLEPVNGSYVLQQHANVTSCATYVIAYNTLHQEMAFQCAETDGMQWIGNLGVKAFPGCDGTYVKNVWQNDLDVACGSDTWVAGDKYGIDNLGISADGHLEAGSPAIDAAESPDGSDYCTGALTGVDRDGDARPVDAACDAGADERN